MKRFLLAIVFGMVMSCGHHDEIPSDIIAPDEMSKLVYDLSRADEYINRYLASKSSEEKKVQSISLYEGIFALYKTDKKSFQKSLHYYAQHPPKMQPVFDSLKKIENRPRTDEDQSADSIKTPGVDSLTRAGFDSTKRPRISIGKKF